MAIRKSPKRGNLFHNFKVFFSVVLLALVHAEYRFRWVDIGTEGSFSDAHIFNDSQLKKIEPYGPNLPY